MERNQTGDKKILRTGYPNFWPVLIYAGPCIYKIYFSMAYSNAECLKKSLIISRNTTRNTLCFKLHFDSDLTGAHATIVELNNRRAKFDYEVHNHLTIADFIDNAEFLGCRIKIPEAPATTPAISVANSDDELFKLDDIYLVIPKYQYGLYHFRISIESSFSFCNLSVCIYCQPNI